MKFVLFAVSFIAFQFTIHAQEFLGPAGRTDTSGSYSVSWNLGEANITSEEKSNFTFTEGFEQPHFILTSVEKINDENIEITVFPNPTSRGIHVRFAKEIKESYQLKILDSQGREIIVTHLDQVDSYIELEELSNASYIITITNSENTYFEKFTLIKSR